MRGCLRKGLDVKGYELDECMSLSCSIFHDVSPFRSHS